MNDNDTIIKKWHNEFSYRDFLDLNNPLAKTSRNSAYGIITSKQVINILCNGTGNGNHYTAENMVGLSVLGISYENFKKSTIYYQLLAKFSLNCIEFFMRNEEDDRIIIINFPRNITELQFNLLVEYLTHIDSLVSDLLNNNPLFLYSDNYERTNDVNVIIEYAKTKINYSKEIIEDNNIIGYTFDEPAIKQ